MNNLVLHLMLTVEMLCDFTSEQSEHYEQYKAILNELEAPILLPPKNLLGSAAFLRVSHNWPSVFLGGEVG